MVPGRAEVGHGALSGKTVSVRETFHSIFVGTLMGMDKLGHPRPRTAAPAVSLISVFVSIKTQNLLHVNTKVFDETKAPTTKQKILRSPSVGNPSLWSGLRVWLPPPRSGSLLLPRRANPGATPCTESQCMKMLARFP